MRLLLTNILINIVTFNLIITHSKYMYGDESSGDELIYLIDFVRHGSRAPKYQHRLNSTKVYYDDGLA
jgi:hypothetical protein